MRQKCPPRSATIPARYWHPRSASAVCAWDYFRLYHPDGPTLVSRVGLAPGPFIIPTMRIEITIAELIPAGWALTALIAVVPMGAITRPKPRPAVMVLTVI